MREGAEVQTQSVLNWAPVIHRSQAMQAHSWHPSVCAWPREPHESEQVWKTFFMFVFLTPSKTDRQKKLKLQQPQSLTQDAHLHETTLDWDMNYHTEGNVNKMKLMNNKYFMLILFSPSASVFPGVLRMKAEKSEQTEKKKSLRMIIR